MALTHRLQRLERVTPMRLCPECGGHGKPGFTVIQKGDLVPPLPAGCPRCGKRRHVLIVEVTAPLPVEDDEADVDGSDQCPCSTA